MDNPDPDPQDPRAQAQPQRRRSPLNRAAVRQFILATARQKRCGWRCERVAGEALDALEAWLVSQARDIVGNPGQIVAVTPPPAQLLVRRTARRMLLEMLREKLPWLHIARLSGDGAVDYLESRLCARIVSLVCGHPTIGKTFKP